MGNLSRLLGAHAAFPAGAGLVYSDANEEATAALRSALKTAGFAMMMRDSYPMSMIWPNRGEGEAEKAEARRSFGIPR